MNSLVKFSSRRITALEEQNEKLLKTVATKDEELRIARLHNKSPEPSYVPKPNDLIRRDDPLIIKVSNFILSSSREIVSIQ